MIKYGLSLKGTGKVLGYSTSSNENGDCCVSISYKLDEYEDNKWLVDTLEQAEYVQYNSAPWYNADYNTPEHYYLPVELEVISVEIIETIIPIQNKVLAVKIKQSALDNVDKEKYILKEHYGIMTNKSLKSRDHIYISKKVMFETTLYVKEFDELRYIIVGTDNKDLKFGLYLKRFLHKKDFEIIES